MQKLISGFHKFQKNELGQYQELFHRLSREGQKPHTLFITCADSRVFAELITQSQPGDLFVVKNIGNIVPANDISGVANSTAAAVEFAVQDLEVSDIVICGHSQCGAMEALLNGLPEKETTPHLHEWLELASPVRKMLKNNYQHLTDKDACTSAAAEENVLLALENLHTYPAVLQKLKENKLHLHGWFFKIATAEMFAYNSATQQFEKIESQA